MGLTVHWGYAEEREQASSARHSGFVSQIIDIEARGRS